MNRDDLIGSLFLIIACYTFWYCVFGGQLLLTCIFGSSMLLGLVIVLLVGQIFKKGGNK